MTHLCTTSRGKTALYLQGIPDHYTSLSLKLTTQPEASLPFEQARETGSIKHFVHEKRSSKNTDGQPQNSCQGNTVDSSHVAITLQHTQAISPTIPTLSPVPLIDNTCPAKMKRPQKRLHVHTTKLPQNHKQDEHCRASLPQPNTPSMAILPCNFSLHAPFRKC